MNQCKLKNKCPFKLEPPVLFNCWHEKCKGFIHQGCCELILDKYEVPKSERPTDGDHPVDGEPVVFCTKTCYLKWWGVKKRELKAAQKGEAPPVKKRKVPWEEDDSLTVLVNWLTTEGNYSCHCGANGDKGLLKAQCHKKISAIIKEKIPGSEREPKDVENKITSLERQFRLACDWTQATGQGVEDSGQFEAAVLKRCPSFKELEPVMGERPNSRPLATNESDDDDLLFGDDELEKDEAVVAVDQSLETPCKETGSVAATGSVSASSVTASVTSSGAKKRLTAKDTNKTKKQKATKKQSTDEIILDMIGNTVEEGEDTYHQLRVREVAAREREANARMMEAQSNSVKTDKETALLSIDEKVKLLKARKDLIDTGVCTADEIDLYLPLKK